MLLIFCIAIINITVLVLFMKEQQKSDIIKPREQGVVFSAIAEKLSLSIWKFSEGTINQNYSQKNKLLCEK